MASRFTGAPLSFFIYTSPSLQSLLLIGSSYGCPDTTDDAEVLQNLIGIIHSIIDADEMKSKSSSAKRLFNTLDLVQKKVAQQLETIKETPTFQMGTKQQQIGRPKTPISVTPVLFFSSREKQIGSPVTPVNAARIRRYLLISPSPIPISADRFQFLVPYTQLMMLYCLRILSSLAPAQRLFNSLDLVEKKVIQQLMR